jgi:hypothetical protein
MKLQDFLIGIGLFAVFSVILFGAINTSNSRGIYSSNYLNITHDADTESAIANISSMGSETYNDFNSISGDMDSFTSNASASQERTESSLVGEGLNVLTNIPKSYVPVSNVMKVMGRIFQIPAEFTRWVVSSIIIIIILILLGSILKNKLES